jgi:hypothetical protein
MSAPGANPTLTTTGLRDVHRAPQPGVGEHQQETPMDGLSPTTGS